MASACRPHPGSLKQPLAQIDNGTPLLNLAFTSSLLASPWPSRFKPAQLCHPASADDDGKRPRPRNAPTSRAARQVASCSLSLPPQRQPSTAALNGSSQPTGQGAKDGAAPGAFADACLASTRWLCRPGLDRGRLAPSCSHPIHHPASARTAPSAARQLGADSPSLGFPREQAACAAPTMQRQSHWLSNFVGDIRLASSLSSLVEIQRR